MRDFELPTDEEIENALTSYWSSFSSIPPVFSTSFSRDDISWKKIDKINYDYIGRILVCHLLIETHINKFIELHLHKFLDIESANLSFSQKLNIVKNTLKTMPVDFFQGITIINKIRNRFSHQLETTIHPSEVGIIVKIIKDSVENSGIENKKGLSIHSDEPLLIIEKFTRAFCIFMAGCCTVAVMASEK